MGNNYEIEDEVGEAGPPKYVRCQHKDFEIMDKAERHLFCEVRCLICWERYQKTELDIAIFPDSQQISTVLEAVVSLVDVKQLGSTHRIVQRFRTFPQVEVCLHLSFLRPRETSKWKKKIMDEIMKKKSLNTIKMCHTLLNVDTKIAMILKFELTQLKSITNVLLSFDPEIALLLNF